MAVKEECHVITITLMNNSLEANFVYMYCKFSQTIHAWTKLNHSSHHYSNWSPQRLLKWKLKTKILFKFVPKRQLKWKILTIEWINAELHLKWKAWLQLRCFPVGFFSKTNSVVNNIHCSNNLFSKENTQFFD